MNFQHIVSDLTGAVHLVSSILSLLFGTIVLIRRKGTKIHRQTGYLYSFSMLILLVTSFMMYNLYGSFGIFHWLALLSTITLLGGIVPMLVRKPVGYVTMHFSFMFWSVFGLYGAFVAEVLVRIPKAAVTGQTINSIFYYMVGVAIFFVMGIGYIIFKRKSKDWARLDK